MTEEVVEEETRRSTLALETPKETMQVESCDGPIRVALEEVATEKQQEVEEEKKKKKEKEKKVGEGEPSHHRKEKKNKEKKEDEEDKEAKLRKKKEKKERKECRHEERRLKKEEEKKKRAASPEMDGESTSVREDKEEPAQIRESTQPEITQVVRDFYHGRLHGTKDVVTIKGQVVPFSARDINELYQMKDNPDALGNKIIDDPTEEQLEDSASREMDLCHEVVWNFPVDGVQYSKIEEADRVYDFMAGLNSKFDTVWSRILGHRPMSSLIEVCSEVRLEEDRTSAMNGTTTTTLDSAAFGVKSFGSESDKQNGKSPPICEHCKKPWHTKDQ
ncbi:stress response protein NST1-like [Benincasa hispida]|uniref:stress response protein NST1-like n=1 Tax=Benincasa hispida TaxID=102211 RepID=UPI0019007171|nr:stress response protein NST1-like [Benincasa hispida]